MENNKVIFDLACPPGISDKADAYLSLIKFLVEELSKYTEVEIYHKEILDEWQERVNREHDAVILEYLKSRAELEGKTVEELLTTNPVLKNLLERE